MRKVVAMFAGVFVFVGLVGCTVFTTDPIWEPDRWEPAQGEDYQTPSFSVSAGSRMARSDCLDADEAIVRTLTGDLTYPTAIDSVTMITFTADGHPLEERIIGYYAPYIDVVDIELAPTSDQDSWKSIGYLEYDPTPSPEGSNNDLLFPYQWEALDVMRLCMAEKQANHPAVTADPTPPQVSLEGTAACGPASDTVLAAFSEAELTDFDYSSAFMVEVTVGTAQHVTGRHDQADLDLHWVDHWWVVALPWLDSDGNQAGVHTFLTNIPNEQNRPEGLVSATFYLMGDTNPHWWLMSKKAGWGNGTWPDDFVPAANAAQAKAISCLDGQ